MMAKIYPRSC